MKLTRFSLFCAAVILAGCASDKSIPSLAGGTAPRPGPVVGTTASSVQAYKIALANHIAAVNGAKMYTGQPQALLRSVVVVKYVVDGDGQLVRSEIMRSNHDRNTEATALATLRNSAPFPRPAAQLLQHGRLELAETWLFNDDGRFQLRSTAQRQTDE
jgi:protein TonB